MAGGKNMPEKFINVDRETIMMFPPDLRNWLPEDSMVYTVSQNIKDIGKIAALELLEVI